MHLYNLTLEHASAIPHAVVGNFSGVRQQEIIVSRGSRLELLKADTNAGKLNTVLVHDVFGSIRSLAAFRLTGGTKGSRVLSFSLFLSLENQHSPRVLLQITSLLVQIRVVSQSSSTIQKQTPSSSSTKKPMASPGPAALSQASTSPLIQKVVV